MIERKKVWSDAARSGLVLGGVSIAYMLCSILLEKVNGGTAVSVLVNVSSLLLWVFKFVLCIKLMKVFMQKFAASNEGATNSDSFRFGSATALLSALLYSAFFLAWVSFIQPDMLADSLEAAKANYADTFTEAQMESIDGVLAKLPNIMFFVNLFWCWLFGTVLAAIFSRNIPSRNPFNDSVDIQ
ncbi:MAG: DUF4199 domain-containing protein [Bacteroidales bacterium]|nr:DUF4199 domain-containing protein [Bacteroidales bacterium]